MVNAVQKWMRKISTLIAAAVIAVVSAISLAATAQAAVTANVVFGGFGDPAGVVCANALRATGHIGGGEQVVLPGYPAHMEPWIDGGMAGSTAKGLPGGIDAVNRLKAEGKRVELHGCSQGTDVAVAVSCVTPPEVTVLHGGPHQGDGIFHAKLLENDLIGHVVANWGNIPFDRQPCGNTHAFYNEGDLWANYMPNQGNLSALFAMLGDTLNGDAHWVQPLHGAKCVFRNGYNVVSHVYEDHNPVTASRC